jgi:hypothetical protein
VSTEDTSSKPTTPRDSVHKKGDRVLVVGRWVTRVYTPAQGPTPGSSSAASTW